MWEGFFFRKVSHSGKGLCVRDSAIFDFHMETMSDINVLRWVFVIENAIILSEKKCSYVAL